MLKVQGKGRQTLQLIPDSCSAAEVVLHINAALQSVSIDSLLF